LTPRTYARRWARYFAGIVLTAFGTTLTIRAGLGISPWDVLADGVRHQTPLTFGQSVASLSILLIAVSWLFGIRPGLATFVNLVLVGSLYDVFLGTRIGETLSAGPMWAQVVLLIAGVAIVGFGAAVYIGAGFGAGPRDSLQLALSLRGGLGPGMARTITEGSALTVGALLGGSVGPGTVISVLGIGVAVRWSFNRLNLDPAGRTSVDTSQERSTV
jgi:uncharacterized membrane protein YczE